MHSVTWVLAGAVLLLAAGGSARADLVRNISTGFDNQTGGLLAPFTVDSDYTVTGPGGLIYFGQARVAGPSLPGTYLGDAALPGSRWLYLVSNPADMTQSFVPSGDYVFRTTVDLTGFDPSTAQIVNLIAAADNGFVSVRVNDAVVFQRTPPLTAEEFGPPQGPLSLGNVGLGAFQSGVNTIELTTRNTGFGFGTGPSPSAFRAVATVEATPLGGPVGGDVPEPAALTLFGLGALGLLCHCWRHRR